MALAGDKFLGVEIDLGLDPSKVVSLGFLISDKQAGQFQLEIAWVKAVRTVAP